MGDDSSSSKGGAEELGDEVASGECSHPMKAPLIEEFENKSKDGPPLTQPQGPAPLIGSRHEEDT